MFMRSIFPFALLFLWILMIIICHLAGAAFYIIVSLPTGTIMLVALIAGIATAEKQPPLPPPRSEAFVEVRSGTLSAFDFPSEAVHYKLPNFSPGLYRIPLEAAKLLTSEAEAPPPGSRISVDLATIMLVDARFEDKLRDIDDRLFEEVNACPSVTYRYDAVVEELGIKFDYLDVGSDGEYAMDISRIERVDDNGTDPAS